MFLVDSAGDWTVLLPNKGYVPNGNPLLPAIYQVPDTLRKKLRPSETPGAEKLFAVEAYWRIDALENLASALANETDSGRARDLGRRLLARLELENAKPDGLHSLRVGALVFHDSGGHSVQEVEKH